MRVMPRHQNHMLNLIIIALAATFVVTFSGIASAAPVLKATELRTEYRTNPLGIAETKPRLSWVLQSADDKPRGQRQTAYQVDDATTRKKLAADQGDLWDPGKTKSDETIQIEYAGRPLKSGERAFWKVKIWNASDEESPWSEPALWSAGLLKESDWKAKWIGYDQPGGGPATTAATQKADPLTLEKLKWVWTDEGDATKKVPKGTRYFAKRIAIPADKKIRKATFILTADDNFQLFINGKKAGNGQGHTRAFENDVTAHIKPGDTFLGIEATNGGDNPAALIGRLVVFVENAAADPLAFDIDNSWKFSIDKPAKWDEGAADLASLKPAKEVVAFGEAPWGSPQRQVLELPPPRYLRRPFTTDKKVTRATVYATALGLYELHLNGQRIGDDVLAPGWTDYKKRVYYQTYDVTDRIKQGDNVLGAILGDGWYSGYFSYQGKRALYGKNPRLRVQLDLTFADGSKKTIATDDAWKCNYGPEREGDLLMGSAYDARREPKIAGWSTPADKNVDDADWRPAAVESSVNANVQPHPGNPVRVHERLPAQKITERSPGVYIFDLGQNIVGWTCLKLKEQKPGTQIKIRHAEMLNPDGSLYLTALRGARAMDTFITKGGAEESWEPKFTFHGFRYVELSGLDKKPDLGAIEGVVVHTDMPRTGKFESSNKLVNQLFSNIIWGQKGNYLEIPTDCPQRDERLG
ncbi:MAG: alpha-L-rhamnosidase, partial [Phycisphaerales bacterium]|nr:alpha-L-rhamnosidase [Phycisphaerales bacterium]